MNTDTLRQALQEHYTNLARASQVSDWGFTMVVYEKILLEVYINKQYISLQNDAAQLYFKLGIADLRWSFSVY